MPWISAIILSGFYRRNFDFFYDSVKTMPWILDAVAAVDESNCLRMEQRI